MTREQLACLIGKWLTEQLHQEVPQHCDECEKAGNVLADRVIAAGWKSKEEVEKLIMDYHRDWTQAIEIAKEEAGDEARRAVLVECGRGEGAPKIICLCGSSRFIETFAVLSWEFEKQGAICLGLHYLPSSYSGARVKDHLAEAEGVAAQMDALHRHKIDLADKVFVINVNGYIGKSTAAEIEYAKAHGKPIEYLEPVGIEPWREK